MPHRSLTKILVIESLDDLKINGALTGGLVCGFIYSYMLPPRFRA